MNEDKEELLNKLLKDQVVVNIVCSQTDIMIEFKNGFCFYIDSKSEIELSVTEK